MGTKRLNLSACFQKRIGNIIRKYLSVPRGAFGSDVVMLTPRCLVSRSERALRVRFTVPSRRASTALRSVVARAPWFSAVSARHSPTRPLSSRDARTRSVDRHSRVDGVSHRASAGGRRNGSGAGVRGFRRSHRGGRRRGRPRNARRGGHRARLERGARSPRRAPPSPRRRRPWARA